MSSSPQAAEVSTTGSGSAEEDEICCNACGFEASFVPEGMLPCERCQEVHYCSVECLKWDWTSGGHDKVCVDKRPAEESSSSEDAGGMDFLAGTPGRNKSNASSFDSDDQSLMSMDVAKVFGLAPGSLDVRHSGSLGATSSNASGSPAGSLRQSGSNVSDSSKSSAADVKEKQDYWEGKTKQNTTTSGPSNPKSPAKKGTTSKLAAFFESQSPKTPEKLPAPLSPSKKKKLQGGMLSSFGSPEKQSKPNVEEDDDDSMGEDDFGYAMGQHVVDDPMDESFDFMDKSVQTVGLKSIVEEGDSWSAEEPDLEGSWRSRNPFDLAEEEERVEKDGSTQPKKNKNAPTQATEKNVMSMLGLEDTENEDHEDSFWETAAQHQESPYQQRQKQGFSYVEPDEYYDEEVIEVEEEASVDEEGSIEEEALMEEEYEVEEEYEEDGEYEEEGEYEDEQQYEEEYEDEQDEEMQEADEPVEQSITEDDEIEHSDRTPDALVPTPTPQRELGTKVSHLTASFRLQTKQPLTPPVTPYMPNNLLSNMSSHSEPVIKNDDTDNNSGSGSQRRRSLSNLSSADGSDSRGAASLLDFRKLYSEKAPQNAPNDGLKDFREAYSGPCEDSISSETDLASKPSTSPDTNADNTSFGSLNTDNSAASKKSVNQALKTSINKALRDFEKLYGAEAARAAVARLTQAVGSTASGAEQSTTGAVVGAVVNGTGDGKTQAAAKAETSPAKSKSLLDRTPKTPKRRERAIDRTLSPSSWAMPSGMSVSSSETEDMGLKMPPGFGGKHPRSQSMPMIGGGFTQSIKRENSSSSWGLTGMSVNSWGNKSDGSPAQGASYPAGSAATTQVTTVKEENVDVSVQSGSGSPTDSTNVPSEARAPEQKSSSSSEFNGPSLQTLGLGRKNKSDSITGQVASRSNHTQESNMVSSWAYGFNPPNSKVEDDYQIAKSKVVKNVSSPSPEQWLADLASSSSTKDEGKPIVETVTNSSVDEEESIGHPFEDEESTGESFDDQGEQNEIEASESTANEPVGELFPVQEESQNDGTGRKDVREISGESTASARAMSVSKQTPRYIQYRDVLAKKHFGEDAARKIDFDQAVDAVGEQDNDDAIYTAREAVASPSIGTDQGEQPRYMKYRSKLATTVQQDPITGPGNGIVVEKGTAGERQTTNTLSAVPSSSTDGSRFQQYRSTLAKRVNPNTTADKADSAKRAKPSEALAPIAVKSVPETAPRYQKYRTLLAKKVSAPGVENTGNREYVQVGQVEKSATIPTPPAFPTIGEPNEAAPDASSELTPRYQKYRSDLAKTVLISPAPASESQNAAATLSSGPVPKNKARVLETLGLVSSLPVGQEVAPVVVAVAKDGSTPRYAQYRTSLAQRLSTFTSAVADVSRNVSAFSTETENVASIPSQDIGAATSVIPETENVAPTPSPATEERNIALSDDSESQSDDDFKAKLSNFLAKSEKGKRPPAIGDFDAPDDAASRQPRVKPPKELADNQSQKIAAALASSKLYLGRQKVVDEEPKESRLQTSDKPETGANGEQKSSRGTQPKFDQGVSVKCGPGMSSDIESGRDRRKVLEPTVSEAELGRKLYLRNQCYAYGLLICLLVAMPLGIGLGIGLTRDDDDRDLPIFITSPTASPAPGLRTVSPTSLDRGVIPSEPTSSPTFQLTSGTPDIQAGTPTETPTDPQTSVPTSSTTAPSSTTSAPTPTLRTSAPTLPPTTSSPTATLVDQELFDLLSSVSSDSGATILDSGSAQNEAYTWLAGTDNLPSLSDSQRIQRYALAALYFSTDGPSWSRSEGWLTTTDECTWYSTGSGESTCDGSGAFVTLDLGFNGLMGTLPPELGLLTGLTRIDLSGGVGPGIGGSLPNQLSSLSALEILSLNDNAITGPLFSEIGDLSDLRILNINDNGMTGSLPVEIGNLARLSFMDLSSNGFSGPLPDTVGNLQNLVTLNIGNNAFTSLPSSISNLGSLGSLSAPFNDLTGPLFDDWSGLGGLQDLDLHSNNLSGLLPASLGELGGLLELDLSDNQFSSNIPASYGGLASVLILRLNSNQLTGNVPAAFGDLQFVTEVRVDDNNLAGSLPAQVCDSFEMVSPKFYLDCATPELSCPPGLCCTYCCTDEVGCECVYSGTSLQYLC
eukprot:scaffold630_cov174-Amphora_coffeaeformis.AAC.13